MVVLTRGGELGFTFLSSCLVRAIGLMLKCLAGEIPHQQGLVHLTVFPGCASSSALEMGSSSSGHTPLAKESAGRRTPRAAD